MSLVLSILLKLKTRNYQIEIKLISQKFKGPKLTRRQSINPRSNHGLLLSLIILPITSTQLLPVSRIKARKAAHAHFPKRSKLHSNDPKIWSLRVFSSKSLGYRIKIGAWHRILRGFSGCFRSKSKRGLFFFFLKKNISSGGGEIVFFFNFLVRADVNSGKRVWRGRERAGQCRGFRHMETKQFNI